MGKLPPPTPAQAFVMRMLRYLLLLAAVAFVLVPIAYTALAWTLLYFDLLTLDPPL
jgi:hypothetical protein